MSTIQRLRRLLLLILGAFALLIPAVASASETTASTTTTSPAPAPEASTSVETPAVPIEPEQPEEAAPVVEAQHSQQTSPGVSSTKHSKGHSGVGAGSEESQTEGTAGEEGLRAKHRAQSPSALTPSLPLSLRESISGVPSFFIESFQIPPFLLPIFQAAGTAYGIPWQVLAAINEVETDYGRDLSVSSAGAEGWMQFLPSSWAQYGLDANGDGYRDPYNPADAIFTAARYLHAAGGNKDIRGAIFAYNHSQQYVDSVLLRAQLLGGTPSELLGAITGLTEARFPVHAAAHFSDGFLSAVDGKVSKTIVGTTIYAEPGAPVIAAQDGEIVQIGDSPTLGHFISLRDAYGNTYTYAQLGDVSSVYPVLEPRVHSAVSPQVQSPDAEAAPTAPATAGVQPRSPISEGGTISGLALGAAASLESAPAQPTAPVAPASKPSVPHTVAPHVKAFSEGSNEVYLHPLSAGVQVIAGTVLGHIESGASEDQPPTAPHLLFQIRPAGLDAPLIDPKPILDGWVALENSSVFHAKGENPFLATSPTVGQVLLESKQQLQRQVLHDSGISLARCGHQDVQEGRVDKRVLAALEYLSVSGLRPTVAGLDCASVTPVALASNAGVGSSSESIEITAFNGVPVAGHQGQGSVADTAVRKLLMLQGLSRPKRILSLMSYPGAAGALTSSKAADAIQIAFAAPSSGLAHTSGLSSSTLGPADWTKLIARLGEIPDPTVQRGPSSAALPDSPASGKSNEGGAGGHS
jgi:murein DD-endopeptidase MepM/ murein hydrolase activator NlpD